MEEVDSKSDEYVTLAHITHACRAKILSVRTTHLISSSLSYSTCSKHGHTQHTVPGATWDYASFLRLEHDRWINYMEV